MGRELNSAGSNGSRGWVDDGVEVTTGVAVGAFERINAAPVEAELGVEAFGAVGLNVGDDSAAPSILEEGRETTSPGDVGKPDRGLLAEDFEPFPPGTEAPGTFVGADDVPGSAEGGDATAGMAPSGGEAGGADRAGAKTSLK